MSKIHLVYPCGSSISTPDAIGRNVASRLIKNHEIMVYDWSSTSVIKPGIDDIIIGHAHPNPFTIFRRSIQRSGWKKRILMQPFTTYTPHVAYLWNVINRVDQFAAITGKYWIDQIRTSSFSAWQDKIFQLELAVDRNDFPLVKLKFNDVDKRRFLYIGNSDSCKNLKYLRQIANEVGIEKFSAIGSKVSGFRNYGRLDFQSDFSKKIIAEHDFLIMTSIADANPTVVLEAMAWGLIPIITPQCGYTESDGPILIPQNDVQKCSILLKDLIKKSSCDLLAMQSANIKMLDGLFNWESFFERLVEVINMPRVSQMKNITRPLRSVMEEIVSDKSFLRLKNFKNFVKVIVKATHAN